MPVAGCRCDRKGFNASPTTESVSRPSFDVALALSEVGIGTMPAVAEEELTGVELCEVDCKAGGGYRAKNRINRGGKAWASLTYWREEAIVAGRS